jgi:hypothetical protein
MVLQYGYNIIGITKIYINITTTTTTTVATISDITTTEMNVTIGPKNVIIADSIHRCTVTDAIFE